MAPEYISKINKIRKLMKISILIYFCGEGVGCSFLFSNQTWFLHFVIYFTRLVRRYIYMYLRTASSCIIHGVLNVWLNQPSLSGYQVLTFKNGGEFSVTDITQKRFCLLELT